MVVVVYLLALTNHLLAKQRQPTPCDMWPVSAAHFESTCISINVKYARFLCACVTSLQVEVDLHKEKIYQLARLFEINQMDDV